MSKVKGISLIILFAITMAYLESAVVVYLRAMYGIEDLLRDINFQPDAYTIIEIGRETATIVMLVIISLIADNGWSKRIGYFFLSFGVWDVFYYIWLYLFIQWPKSLFEWDVLFLIPLPWWGPVIAPVLISILLISTGYLLIREISVKVKLFEWIIFSISILLILFNFMEDSINIILTGNGDLTNVRPTNFNWILFSVSFLTWICTTLIVFRPVFKNCVKN